MTIRRSPVRMVRSAWRRAVAAARVRRRADKVAPLGVVALCAALRNDLARAHAHLQRGATAIQDMEDSIVDAEGRLAQLEAEFAAVLRLPPRQLAEYRESIDRFNSAQSNREMLDAIRQYNHQVIDVLHAVVGLPGMRVLDVGASPHGYALERVLDLRAAAYFGIGLDVAERTVVCGPSGVGELLHGDAEQLPFEAESFDTIVSLSTFEHILDMSRSLVEMHRVTRPGGAVLITIEPLWTCSYGHHLHHFGAVSQLVPPWAHLWWSPADMRRNLRDRWPADAPVTLGQAVAWVYTETGLNRIGIRDMRSALGSSPLLLEWIESLQDTVTDEAAIADATRRTGLTRDELLTKGFSVLLRRRD